MMCSQFGEPMADKRQEEGVCHLSFGTVWREEMKGDQVGLPRDVVI